MALNLCYVTARKEPHLEWFLSSLAKECGGDFSSIQIIIVDYWANPFGGTKADHEARRAYVFNRVEAAGIPEDAVNWVSPKSTPWQGRQRQTQRDWFNVANSRNTALCYCEDGHVAFIDDLSVLMPGWLNFAAQAVMAPKTVTCCGYQKVRNLIVEKGAVISFDANESGRDSRLKHARRSDRPLAPCPNDWHYGYVLGPVGAYLDVNGWVETDAAGLGFEDMPTGINLARKGYAMRYDPRMLALETEDGHDDTKFHRADYGISPNDKSHWLLHSARTGDGWARNDFGNGMNLRELRDHVFAKASNPFPTPRPNAREPWSGILLSQLHLHPDGSKVPRADERVT
jgi:hypothetical protein